MHHNYDDITSRIDTPPRWFDEHAVPRYCDFGPRQIADVYAEECCLLEIQCQACGTPFMVAMSWGTRDRVYGTPKLSSNIQAIHYGDPPNIDCCSAGATMNSEPLRVHQFWRCNAFMEFVRVPDLEVRIDDDEPSEDLSP